MKTQKYKAKKIEKERNVACWIDGNGRLLNHLHFKLDLCRSCFAHSQECASLSLSFCSSPCYLHFSLSRYDRNTAKSKNELNWAKKKKPKKRGSQEHCVVRDFWLENNVRNFHGDFFSDFVFSSYISLDLNGAWRTKVYILYGIGVCSKLFLLHTHTNI